MYRHKGILFQATRILQSPEGVPLRLLEHWLVAGATCDHPKASFSDHQDIGWLQGSDLACSFLKHLNTQSRTKRH